MSDISVLAELERCGIEPIWASENEVKVCCPFHDDESPSCHVNIQKRVFKCQTAGCGKSGDFITFLAGLLKCSRKVIIEDLSSRYDLNLEKTINPETVERYHGRLKKAAPLLAELKARGVSDSSIRKYRLGETEGRITIPIKNSSGYFVNIRKYLPGAPGASKMRNLKGMGKNRLFPIEQLDYDEILVCGGEIKAIVAAQQLNKHGIGCVSPTAGEGNWEPSFNKHFIGKKIWVCLDIDDEGQTAAHSLCTWLHRGARWIGNVVLPLDVDKYPHGDINDFVAQERGSLKRVLNDTEEWLPKIITDIVDEDPREMSLLEATHARNAKKRFKIKAVVASMDTAPYSIPKVIRPVCDKSQKECSICPIFVDDSDKKLHPESAAILEMVARPKASQREALMDGIGIPKTCKIVQFEAQEFYNCEDVRLSPRLEITSREAERAMQPAVCIGDGLETNETYEMIGRMYPHPLNQQSTLLVSDAVTADDALSTYKAEDLDELEIFQPEGWTVDLLKKRLGSIYEDLSANKTKIFKRDSIHLIVDLAYHSPLFFNFDGEQVKGWVEVLVVGDSAQGKSKTFVALQNHYQLGEKVECKNATVAGLLGGLQQMGNRWWVTWGMIPTHDKRLICLEEVKGTSTEVLGKLTDMRSSGVAELDKIEKRRTHARTRLIALSNPRSDLPVAAYNFGIETIKELIGGLEDIRRFDACLIVSADDIDASDINVLHTDRPVIEHTYTSDLCKKLILWAWTLEPDRIQFEDEGFILEQANDLCSKFSDRIPIIDRGSMRHKLARLSASLAARTFSYVNEGLLVRSCHVELICDWLQRIYTSGSFGYDDFTQAIEINNTLLSPKDVKKRLQNTPFPGDFLRQVLNTIDIDMQSICDWCAWDRSDAQELLSFLVRKHAFVRRGRTYRKTPPFIMMIKEMIRNKDFPERPDYIPEDF